MNSAPTPSKPASGSPAQRKRRRNADREASLCADPVDIQRPALKHVVIAHDELLVAVQPGGDFQVALAEAEITEMPDDVLRADHAILAAHQLCDAPRWMKTGDRGSWPRTR